MDKEEIIRIISLAMAVYQGFGSVETVMKAAKAYESHINGTKGDKQP